MSNEAIAQQFLELADLTDFVGDSPFKSRAYRQAAQVLESLQTPIETLAENGVDAHAKNIPHTVFMDQHPSRPAAAGRLTRLNQDPAAENPNL